MHCAVARTCDGLRLTFLWAWWDVWVGPVWGTHVQPRILRHLHKSSRFDVPLRTIAELSSAEAHRGTLTRLNRILAHYRRPNFVLQLEAEESRAMGMA